MKRPYRIIGAALTCAIAAGCNDSADPVRPAPAPPEPPPRSSAETGVSGGAMPHYVPIEGMDGTIIVSIGASTTTHLVARLAADFRKLSPGVTMRVSSSPISIGPQALLDGRADLVPMSRPLTSGEVRSFAGKYGYPPTEIAVAADALAIYVEKNNPLPGLTLDQLDAIFSQTQRPGVQPIDTWGQLGLGGEWADRPIVLYGYGPQEGAHLIFRQQVLHGKPFRLALRDEGSGSSIMQGVAANPAAMGFASIFFVSKAVRIVPLAGADGNFYDPTVETIRNRNYPLSRFLYICINKPPGRPYGGSAGEFLRFMLSHEGQQLVAASGNMPLDEDTVNASRRRLLE